MERFLRNHILRDLYAPHPWWGFDGPYTRLQMDDGSSFIFIMSSVWKAKNRPHLAHLSYSPLPHMNARSANEVEAFACDFYPDRMEVNRRKQDDSGGTASFTLSATISKQNASFKLDVRESGQTYDHSFVHPKTGQNLNLNVRIEQNTPHSLLGPMWIGRFLPVPLKWQVFSTRSKATVTIRENDKMILRKEGLAHQEKNWGIGRSTRLIGTLGKSYFAGFPNAWIWCQGFSTPEEKGSLALAGGMLTSFLTSFMLAYRSPTTHRQWNFGPAWTMQFFKISPFCKLVKCQSEDGEIQLQCTNPIRGQRIIISGKADPKTFQVMSAPLPNGHTPWYCHESFQALYKISLYEKAWFQDWKKVEETTMSDSALEYVSRSVRLLALISSHAGLEVIGVTGGNICR